MSEFFEGVTRGWLLLYMMGFFIGLGIVLEIWDRIGPSIKEAWERSQNTARLCKDCKWHYRYMSGMRTIHECGKFATGHDLVTGGPSMPYCKDAREDESKCGGGGKHFYFASEGNQNNFVKGEGNYCFKCKHRDKHRYLCHYSAVSKTDIVTGEVTKSGIKDCERERSYNGSCGAKGIHFVKKDW